MAHHRVGRKRRFSDLGSIVQSDEASLKEVLFQLATVLLPLGVTPRTLSNLSSEAFVHAAAATAKLRNGKINQSRVSAQTGLTRAHVRQILSGNNRHSRVVRGRTPIELATNGWRSDRAFTGASGQPKPLPITGSKGSFVALARKYARDVPHRALLCELERVGMVIVSNGRVRLESSRTKGGVRVLTSTTRNFARIEAIHRFTFSRDDATDGRIARREFKRLASLLSKFKHTLNAKASLPPSGHRRGRDALFVLTLILSEAEKPNRAFARPDEDVIL